jgi:hypothetical protein
LDYLGLASVVVQAWCRLSSSAVEGSQEGGFEAQNSTALKALGLAFHKHTYTILVSFVRSSPRIRYYVHAAIYTWVDWILAGCFASFASNFTSNIRGSFGYHRIEALRTLKEQKELDSWHTTNTFFIHKAQAHLLRTSHRTF